MISLSLSLSLSLYPSSVLFSFTISLSFPSVWQSFSQSLSSLCRSSFLDFLFLPLSFICYLHSSLLSLSTIWMLVSFTLYLSLNPSFPFSFISLPSIPVHLFIYQTLFRSSLTLVSLFLFITIYLFIFSNLFIFFTPLDCKLFSDAVSFLLFICSFHSPLFPPLLLIFCFSIPYIPVPCLQ